MREEFGRSDSKGEERNGRRRGGGVWPEKSTDGGGGGVAPAEDPLHGWPVNGSKELGSSTRPLFESREIF